MTRKPFVSGQFYPSNPDVLKQFLSETLEFTSMHKDNSLVKGLISPHAGYLYSGKCSALGYKELINKKIDLFIILGTNHQGRGTSICLEDYETPLGILKTAKLSLHLSKTIKISLHENEHSIEVQLPFIKYLFPNAKIIPIIIGEDWLETSKKIIPFIKENSLKPCIIMSSDFTHYGLNYDYTPFSQIRNPNLLQKNIKSLDEESISYIKKLDSHGFVENCDKKEKTICGKYAIACGLEILNELNVKKVRIINYSTSAEITKDTESSVSYCSIIFE
ncbi:AmmeMemoRadiSam system protein B [Candidatus Woesearchaeota archaeon]|nr:AmmeMemoRadiSam system protein B [Candidatus Woesearchaeota archaeon]